MSNDSNSEIPEWLELSLFEPIIEKELGVNKSKFNLKFTSVKPAVAQGENYVSMVTRVQLAVQVKTDMDETTKSFGFIIKSNIKGLPIIEEMQMFEKEMEFFNDVIPQLKKFDRTIEFAPVCYVTTKTTKKLIIMEDLTTRGYRMQNRQAGLDLDHCKLYYKKLAEFHAISAAHHAQFGNYDKKFHTPYFNVDYKPFFEARLAKSMTEFLEIFDRYDCLQPFKNSIKNYGENMFDSLYKLMLPKPDEFLVLNHGDSWMNNVLFRYDENGNPIDSRLVDFQIVTYGSPLMDIFYFFVSSASLEVRANNFDDVLRTYHNHLVANLKRLNYCKRIPTLRELQIESLEKGLLAAYFMTVITPIALVDSADSAASETMMKDGAGAEKYRYNLYNNPRFVKAVEITCNFLDNRGMLEKS